MFIRKVIYILLVCKTKKARNAHSPHLEPRKFDLCTKKFALLIQKKLDKIAPTQKNAGYALKYV